MSAPKKFSFTKVAPATGATPAAPAAAAAPAAPVNPAPAAVASNPAPAPVPQTAATPAPVEVVANVPANATPVSAPAAVPAVPAAPAAAAPHVTPALAGTALAVAPAAGAVVEHRAPASYGDDSDDVGVEDINLPRLNIVQKVGDLSNQFTEGDIVLNKESVILKSPKTDKSNKGLRIVVCGFRKDRYAEKTVGGAKGDIVDSEAEVFAKGATTDWNESKATGKKLYQTLAECLVLIEKPDDVDDPAFSYFVEGKAYALAVWAQKGTAYTNGTKILRTARKAGWLKDEFNPDGTQKVKRGYSHGVWELRTELGQYGTNFAWKPVLRRTEYTSPALQQFAAQVLG